MAVLLAVKMQLLLLVVLAVVVAVAQMGQPSKQGLLVHQVKELLAQMVFKIIVVAVVAVLLLLEVFLQVVTEHHLQ